jgi:nitrate reductase (cytochrome)
VEQERNEGRPSRRDLLRIAGGVAVANGLGLEWLVAPAGADTWHKSVCRLCGTGCGIEVGLRDGRVTEVRGDELAPNQGVICVKGAMLRALPDIPGNRGPRWWPF